jgi:hypothetical protein
MDADIGKQGNEAGLARFSEQPANIYVQFSLCRRPDAGAGRADRQVGFAIR